MKYRPGTLLESQLSRALHIVLGRAKDLILKDSASRNIFPSDYVIKDPWANACILKDKSGRDQPSWRVVSDHALDENYTIKCEGETI